MIRAFVAVALAGCGTVLGQEDERRWGPPQELCTLDDARIDESSGVAASRLRPGVFFTHNDSGDAARFFRFARDGRVTGTYTLKGVQARDWEDMSSAEVGGEAFLYFADVGDNAEVRESVVVHRVPEPTGGGDQTLTDFQSYTVKYPYGAHNCEGMFVTSGGDVWVVTKHDGGDSRVYMLPRPQATGTYAFKHVADILIDTGGHGGKRVTGAAISPDGKFVVLRTYTAALEFAVPSKFSDWMNSMPNQIRLQIEVQGEAICYAKDGGSLVTTSEYAPCEVSIVALEGSLAPELSTGSDPSILTGPPNL